MRTIFKVIVYIYISFLKTRINLNYLYRFSLYYNVNTLRLGDKNQLFVILFCQVTPVCSENHIKHGKAVKYQTCEEQNICSSARMENRISAATNVCTAEYLQQDTCIGYNICSRTRVQDTIYAAAHVRRTGYLQQQTCTG